MSSDGFYWQRLDEPVLSPPNQAGYYTTPAILRGPRGGPMLKDGAYMMWFTGDPKMGDLHLATSTDGMGWTIHQPDPIARGVYSPTVIFDEGRYRMWFTATTPDNRMVIQYATSLDGISWRHNPAPIIERSEIVAREPPVSLRTQALQLVRDVLHILWSYL